MSIQQIKKVLQSVAVLLTLLVFIQSCEKSDSKSLLGALTLTTNETKVVTHQNKKISITASDFKDSRCPINADCVWQGYASVKLTFKDDVKEQDLLLCLGGCAILAVPLPETVTLNGTVYKIKLEEITPYPTLDKVMQQPSTVKVSFSAL